MTRASGRSYDFAPGGRPTPRAARSPKLPSVVDLSEARDGRRLRDHQDRLRSVSDANRRALTRLFQSGLIYTRTGARLGRDLLLAHQHLLRVSELLLELGELAQGGERRSAAAEELHAEVQELLARTSAVNARSDGLLARER